jgi:O-antigen ligase
VNPAKVVLTLSPPDAAVLSGLAATGLLGLAVLSPLLAVLAIGTGLAAWIAYRFPGLAIGGLGAATLLNISSVLAENYGIPGFGTLIVVGLAAVFLWRVAAGRSAIGPLLPLAVVAAAYFSFYGLMVPWLETPGPTVEALVELAKNLLVVLLVVGFIDEPGELRIALRTTVASVGAVAALSVVQYALGLSDGVFFGLTNMRVQQIAGEINAWRSSGPLPDPNFYAQSLVMMTPVAFALALSERGIVFRAGALGAGLAMLAAILLTFSRGALAGVAVVSILTVLFVRRRWMVMSVLGGFLAIAVVFAPPNFWERVVPIGQAAEALVSGSQAVSDPSLGARIDVFVAAIEMFTDHPVIGTGLAQFEVEYPAYALRHGLDLGAPPNAHNMFLETAAEGGVLGLLILLGILWVAVRSGTRASTAFLAERERADGLLMRGLTLGFLGYLVTAFFLHDAFPRFFWMHVGLLLAGGLMGSRLLERNASHGRN